MRPSRTRLREPSGFLFLLPGNSSIFYFSTGASAFGG